MKKLIVSLLIILFPAHSFSQDIDRQKLQSLLDEYPIGNGPGISISVVKNGKELYSHYEGFANLELRVPISDSSKFVVGSISKQFTAFSILLLESQGKLSIEDDITHYLPELSGLNHTISIKHFMNHTSGFRGNYDLIRLKGQVDNDIMAQDEMVDLLLRQSALNFKPGTRFQYCNAGYVLLAEIVERVSGMRFTDFTQQFIFEPLQMENSLFLDYTDQIVKNRAGSYKKYSKEYGSIPYNSSIKGSTGLHSTVSDLGLWAQNFQNMTVGNTVLFEKMRTKSRLNSGDSIPYTLGQEVKTYKGLDVVFHGGGDAGFRSYLVRVPGQHFSVAISGNFESFNPLNLAYGLIDVFLSDEIVELEIRDAVVYKNKDLQQWVGEYQIFPGLYIIIEAEGDTLYFKSYGSEDKQALPVLGENIFEFKGRAHSKFVFFGDSLNWHFSDFSYPGKKVELVPYENENLNEYIGMYNSSELETSYRFVLKDDGLIATHGLQPDIKLQSIAKDTFITDTGFLGRLAFKRNAQGELIGCDISAQSSYDIAFRKME